MRTMLVCLVIVLASFLTYAYTHNPSGCKKVLDDSHAVLVSLWPITLQPNAAPQDKPADTAASIPAKPQVEAAPVPTATPTPAPAAADASSNPIKPWTPPDVMPSQPNWTWATSDGKTYQNVVVTKIEPDTVSITHSMGVAHVPISTLPPDIQKQLNYDPHAASELTALITDKLISADGNAAGAPSASVRYYAIYYSA